MELDKTFITQHDMNGEGIDNADMSAIRKAVSNIKNNGFTKSGKEQSENIMSLADKNSQWLYTNPYKGSAIAMPDDILQNSIIGKTGSSKVNITDANDTQDYDDEDDLIDSTDESNDEYMDENEGEFI